MDQSQHLLKSIDEHLLPSGHFSQDEQNILNFLGATTHNAENLFYNFYWRRIV